MRYQRAAYRHLGSREQLVREQGEDRMAGGYN